MKQAKEIENLLQPLLEETELFIVDITVSPKNVIEVFIDSVTGVDVSTCIRISKQLEELLNREEEDFELTVSSAGIGYPFKVEGQYRKNIGKEVEIKFTDNSKLQGILKQVGERELWIEYEEKVPVPGKKKKEIVKKEKAILRTDIKQIKDIVTF